MSLRTKGPWRSGKNADCVVADYPAGHEQDPHGIDYYGGHLVAESIHSSNRPIIIAAPTMLEALENLENDAGHIPPRAWEMVQAAIALAKGGSHEA